MSFTEHDIRFCREMADLYRRSGWNPLPSSPAAKKPMLPYADLWERPLPKVVFDSFETPNLQLMTGRFWGLLVIDLDGPEAEVAWRDLCPVQPRTWVTHSGGRGRHVWFTVPRQGTPLPYGELWRPDPTKPRQKDEPAVERIGDRRLVMAPPSVHPGTGRVYRFLEGHTPREMVRPAPAPAWVLSLPILKTVREPFGVPAPAGLPREPACRYGDLVTTREVLAAVPNLTALAASWGLRIASHTPNASGWLRCHAVGREDRHPSASFHPGLGVYWEAQAGSVRFLDLAVLLGAYADWRDARDDLADRYIVTPRRLKPLPDPQPRRVSQWAP